METAVRALAKRDVLCHNNRIFFAKERDDMQTVASIVLFALFSGIVITIGLALLVKLWAVNKDELAEIRRFQGGFRNLWKGSLHSHPNEFGDFRIVRGLKWDRHTNSYISQSGLSSEGLRAAFPK